MLEPGKYNQLEVLRLTTSGAYLAAEAEEVLLPQQYVPAGLKPGTYNGTITITAPGAGNSSQNVPVTLVIVPATPSVAAILNDRLRPGLRSYE